MKSIAPDGIIEQKIFSIRGQRVMLSTHLAGLYGVEIRAFVQSVKRNIERFPEDFMFQLNKEEYQNLKSQFVISSWGGSRRAFPYAFTEQGVAMLSGVLRSKRATEVNIAIMRAFVKLRRILSSHKELAYKLKGLEERIVHHDQEIKSIFTAIRQLMHSPPRRERVIKGFANGRDC